MNFFFHEIHPEVLYNKKGVTRNFNFIKKETLAQVYFLVNFVKFLRTSFLQNTTGRLLFIVQLIISDVDDTEKQSSGGVP